MTRRGRAKIYVKSQGISARANMDTIHEMDKFAISLKANLSEMVVEVAESVAAQARQNVRALHSKAQGRYGVRAAIADNIEVRTQALKSVGIARARVAVDYGLGSLQSLAHLLEFGFRLTAAFYGRERDTPIDIPPRPFMRPAYQSAQAEWGSRVASAVSESMP